MTFRELAGKESVSVPVEELCRENVPDAEDCRLDDLSRNDSAVLLPGNPPIIRKERLAQMHRPDKHTP